MEVIAGNLIGIGVMTIVIVSCTVPFLWDWFKRR